MYTSDAAAARMRRDAAAIESAALHAVVTWVSASASRNWSIAASSQSCSMSYPVMFRYVTQPISCSFACVAPSFLDTGPVATYTGGPMPAFASLHASRNALYASPALLFRRFCFAEASRRAALNPLSLSLPNMLFCAIFITSVTCGDGRKSSCASFAVHASKACEPRHVHHSRVLSSLITASYEVMTESSVETIVPPGYAYDAPSSPCLSLAVMHRSGPPASSMRCQSPLVIDRHPCSSLATRSSRRTVSSKWSEVYSPTASCMPASSAILR